MSEQPSKDVVLKVVKIFISGEPRVEPSGALVFRYGVGLFYLAVAALALLVGVVAVDPPTKPNDLCIALLLIAAALFMCVQSRWYALRLEHNVLTRYSPWPWHRQNRFLLSDIATIDLAYKALHLSLIMEDGRELRVPMLLKGAFKLLQRAVNEPGVIASDRVKAMIAYYARL